MLDAVENYRMMGDDKIGIVSFGFFDDLVGTVQSENHAADFCAGVTDQQTSVIKIHCQAEWCNGIHRLKNIVYCHSFPRFY